uniref:Large ribosomal subunit protein bL33m n=1 Tax=Scophthalmus maximus TaxID=52904 RepID=A0A8D3AWW7_SCOMX
MFLTTVNCTTVLVQMMSAAGTGYFFNTKRNRLKDKMVIRKHDPLGNHLATGERKNSLLTGRNL